MVATIASTRRDRPSMPLDLGREIGKTKTHDCASKPPGKRPMTTVFRLGDFRHRQKRVFFTRLELNQLLSLYSRQVMRGEWRDYAIDQRDGAALFSVFRRSQESPLYTIVKTAPGLSRQGDYLVLSGRQRLVSGGALNDVLAGLQRRLGPMAVRLDESRG
jgi:hypothetical protein